MKIEDCQKEAEKLLEDFRNLGLVKRYQAAKKSLEENERLSLLKKEREDLQHSLRFFTGEEKKEGFEKARELEKQYQEDPLVINYETLKEEVYQLLAPLTEANL